MGIIRLLVSLLVLGGLALGGVYLAEKKSLVPAGTFNGLIARVGQTKPQQILQHSAKLTSLVTSQASQTASAGAVLGSSITVEKNDPPLTQKAFEYARYTYCKTAVADYESRFPTTP